MTRTQLNKKIRSLRAELANGQFRSAVIERRIETLTGQVKALERDTRPRQRLVRENTEAHVAGLRIQLADTYETVLRSYLELQEATAELDTIPYDAPPEPRDSRERKNSTGLYRMGRLKVTGIS